jgi:hypothetical protein
MKYKEKDADAAASQVIKKHLTLLALVRRNLDQQLPYKQLERTLWAAENIWINIEKVASIRLKVTRDCIKVITKKKRKK